MSLIFLSQPCRNSISYLAQLHGVMGRFAGAELYIALTLLVRCGAGQPQGSLEGTWIPQPRSRATARRGLNRSLLDPVVSADVCKDVSHTLCRQH